jgi:O-antigen ligase
MLYFFYPKAFKIITIVMIIAILVVLSSPLLMELLRLADDPFTAREKLWQIALESWKHHRLLGTGFGTANLITESTYLLYTHKVTAFLLGSHFHNMYLEILSETGIIGFSFFVFLLSSFFIKSIKVIRQSIEPDRILAISFFGLLVGVSILCFFESAILSAGTVPSIVFWLLGGLVLSDPSPSSLNPL